MKLSKKITSWLLVFLIVASMAVGLPASSMMNSAVRNASVSDETSAGSKAQTYSVINGITKNYSGSYYNPIGGLDSLAARTDSEGIVQDLRALIDYSTNSAKTTLGTTIKGTDSQHPAYSGTGSNSLASWYPKSDRAENDTNSGFKLFYTHDYTTTSNWNREHVWPQSQSGGLYGKTGAGSDLHHIRPTYNKDNSTRGNYPYGEVETVTKTIYVDGDSSRYVIATMGDTASGKYAFEPLDEYKGDIARIVAYMVTHYQSLYNIVDNVLVGGYSTLVKWNELDPVDDIEINRNNVAFEAQGNRNPFIDCPDLINSIWGNGGQTVTKYSVSYSLSNVESSNNALSVEKNTAYQTTLTASAGYTMSTVKVTMGGSDVTSSSYTASTGNVYIADVTGNVSISASAAKNDTPTPPTPTPGESEINYTGTYYDVIGGLESLAARTDSTGIVQDLRALIDYSSNSAKTTLGTTIKGTDSKHPKYSGSGSNSLASWYPKSDRAENDTNKGFKLFYSRDYTTTSNWNREHVWPQSQSGGLYGTTGAGADLHHIRPTYNKDNSARSNFPYGDVETVTKTVYVDGDSSRYVIATMGDTANGTYAFEPLDEYKGDIARIIAYMVTHYESLYNIVENVMVGGYSTLVEWNAIDPVDDVELNRNNVAFEAQGNRNPFIDCPSLINNIWGKGGETVTKYSVSYSLSNVNSSSNVASVNKNSSYSTTLTAASGYTMSTVKVTMGGSDVTSSSYTASTGSVKIDNVTGNISISATATKDDTPTPPTPTPGESEIYYTGTYYDVIGGLEDLVARTDGTSTLTDLRALIDYSSNSATTSLGTTIKGTDSKHPTYGGTSANSLASWYPKSDRAENDTNKGFKLFYSRDYTTTSNWNREHVWPQSQSGGLYGTTGAGADLHHIRPTYNKDNSARSNYPYGDVETVSKTVYVNGDSSRYKIAELGDTASGRYAFEPLDEYKGDVARIIAYMVTHYESLYNIVDNVIVGGYSTLVEWNRIDPVDDIELNRNNVAFEAQGNRNPFIDCPTLIETIWGSAGPIISNDYTVTSSLTNVKSSNTASKVAKESSYSTTLTADDGYVISSVSVTMGGTDITNDCYKQSSDKKSGTISISKVTGRIIIKASAQRASNPNQFVKISSGSEITVGSELIVAFGSDAQKMAAAGTVTGSYLNTKKLSTDGDIAYPTDNNVVWVVGEGTTEGTFTLLNKETNVYLAGSGNSTGMVVSANQGSNLYLADDVLGEFVLINENNNNRFLGSNSAAYTGLKWYAYEQNIGNSNLPHFTTFYVKGSGSSEDPERGDYDYILDSGDAVITKFNKTDSTDVNIPSEIDGHWVIAVDDNAFSGMQSIETVTIPSSVTELGNRVFSNCKNLKKVTFGLNVDTIGEGLFAGCSSLAEVDMPTEITEIPAETFADCTSLSRLTFTSNVKKIGANAFKGCTSIVKLRIPESVTEIGDGAFKDCAEMVSAKLPYTVNAISNSMFENCASIKNLEIPVTISKVGANAFKGCTALSSINIDSRFSGKKPRRTTFRTENKANLAETLTIGENAFENCVNLKTVKIPSKVTEIGSNAFANCSGLYMAGVFNKTAVIGSGAFSAASAAFKLYGYENSTADTSEYAFVNIDTSDMTYLKESVFVAADALKVAENGEYTVRSVNALKAAYEKGSALVTIGKSNQYDIDAADLLITDAIDGLQKRATNFEDLAYAIEMANNVDVSPFSEESVNYFYDVLEDAVAIYEDKDYSQDDVDAITQKLIDAMTNLKYAHSNY